MMFRASVAAATTARKLTGSSLTRAFVNVAARRQSSTAGQSITCKAAVARGVNDLRVEEVGCVPHACVDGVSLDVYLAVV